MLELYGDFVTIVSPYFMRFSSGLLILLIGFILARLSGRIVKRVLHSLDLNATLRKLTDTNIAAEEVAESFTIYFIYFVTIVIVLQHLGLATTVLNMIAGAVIIILVLATVLGIKDVIPNIIAGLSIRQKNFLQIGNVIKVKGMKGKIVAITLLETKIETPTKDLIFIPNSVLTKTEVIKLKNMK